MLTEQVAYLRSQLDQDRQAPAEARRSIGGLVQRVPELEASRPSEPRESTVSLAEVEMAEEPEWGLRRDALGIHSLSRMGDGGPVRRCDVL
jgi:hypothetical protein